MIRNILNGIAIAVAGGVVLVAVFALFVLSMTLAEGFGDTFLESIIYGFLMLCAWAGAVTGAMWKYLDSFPSIGGAGTLPPPPPVPPYRRD